MLLQCTFLASAIPAVFITITFSKEKGSHAEFGPSPGEVFMMDYKGKCPQWYVVENN